MILELITGERYQIKNIKTPKEFYKIIKKNDFIEIITDIQLTSINCPAEAITPENRHLHVDYYTQYNKRLIIPREQIKLLEP